MSGIRIGMRTVLLVIAALALSAIAWLVLPGSGPASLPAVGARDTDGVPGSPVAADIEEPLATLRPGKAVSPAARAVVPAAQRAEAAPLPPVGTPLVDIIDELDARAAAGDAAAACRLAAEVARCDQVLGMDAATRERAIAANIARRQAREGGRDDSIDEAARALEREALLIAQCDGVPSDWFPRRPHLDLRAARLGDLDAAVRFVNGEGMTAGELVRDPALATLYRAHAWSLFLELYEAGDLVAVLLWSSGTADARQQHLISAVMPDEWRHRREVASALAHQALESALRSGHAVVSQAPSVSPEAQLEAETLFRQRFAASERFKRQQEVLLNRQPFDVPLEHCDEL